MQKISRFKIGDRIKPGEDMKSGMPQMARRIAGATVTGFGRREQLIRVKVDGRKTIKTFHEDWWEIDEAPEATGPCLRHGRMNCADCAWEPSSQSY